MNETKDWFIMFYASFLEEQEYHFFIFLEERVVYAFNQRITKFRKDKSSKNMSWFRKEIQKIKNKQTACCVE